MTCPHIPFLGSGVSLSWKVNSQQENSRSSFLTFLVFFIKHLKGISVIVVDEITELK